MKLSPSANIRFQAKDHPSNPRLEKFRRNPEAVLLTLTYRDGGGLDVRDEDIEVTRITGHEGRLVQGLSVPEESAGLLLTRDEVDTLHFNSRNGGSDEIHHGDYEIDSTLTFDNHRVSINKQVIPGFAYNRSLEKDEAFGTDPSVRDCNPPRHAWFVYPRAGFREKLEPLREQLSEDLTRTRLEAEFNPSKDPDVTLRRKNWLIHQFILVMERLQD